MKIDYIYIYIYIRFELFKPSLETAMTTTRDKHETNEIKKRSIDKIISALNFNRRGDSIF